MANLKFKSSEEVKKAIMVTQQQEIKQLYDDWADELEEKVKYYSHKTNASAPVTERYYKELQKQIRETSQQVSNEIYQKIKTNIYMVSDAVVKDNVEWLKMFGFSEEGLNAAFSFVPNQTVQKLVTGQIYEGGWNLSSKIWGDNEQTLKDIYKVMARGLAENKPIYDIAKDLETYVRPEAKLAWNLKDPNGGKIYKKKVDYNAQRLARTLVQHGYQQSFIETTKENPFVTKYRWLSNGSRVCPLCLARHGQLFDKDKLPMDHPNGMCVMEPVVADDMNDQLANWFNSPDGTYPEIDKFASNFGYEGSSVTDIQSYIDKYGKTSKPYSSWYKSMTVAQKAEGASLKAKEGLSWEKWFNKYISDKGSATAAPAKTVGKKKVASEAAAGLSKGEQKAITELESKIAKMEANLNALKDEIDVIPAKTVKKVYTNAGLYNDLDYVKYSSDEAIKQSLKEYVKSQKEALESMQKKSHLSEYDKKMIAKFKKNIDEIEEFEEYVKKIDEVNEKILKEKKSLSIAKKELKKITNADDIGQEVLNEVKSTKSAGKKKVQAFSDAQEKYLKPYGFTKDNMPIDFNDWSHKVSYDQASEILKSMGTSWADPHPYQQLMKFYDKNLTDQSFVMKAASSVKKVESAAKTVEAKAKVAASKFDSASWGKAVKNNNLNKMESWCDDWLRVISPEERHGVTTYTGSAFTDMNNYLRGQRSSTRYSEEIKQATAALKKASLPEEVIVRRGSDYNMLRELGVDISEANKDKLIGAIVNEKGFMSTSPASDGGFTADIEYVIKVPKGSQAMYVDTISKYQGEQELLINRGSKYIIEEIEFNSRGDVNKIYMTLKNLKGSK